MIVTNLLEEVTAMRAEISEVRALLLHLIDALAEEQGDGESRTVTDLDGRAVVLSSAANGSLDDA